MKTTLLALSLACALLAADLQVGQPLAGQKQIALADLAAKPETYVGQTFQVKGRVTEVCQVMGCWVMLTDGKGAMVRIQMEDGKVAFPKDVVGLPVVAEGKMAKYDLTREEAIAMAKHEAEDAGRPFHPEAIKAPYVYYQIEGTGAVVSK